MQMFWNRWWCKHPLWLRVIVFFNAFIEFFITVPQPDSLALNAMFCVSILWICLWDFIYFSLQSRYLKQEIYKELVRCYIRARPDRGTPIEEITAWKKIMSEMNKYINTNEFKNVSKNYSENVSYNASDLKSLFEKSLVKFEKKESSDAWKKILRAVQRLRDQDVLASLKSNSCKDLIELISEEEDNNEVTPDVLLQ